MDERAARCFGERPVQHLPDTSDTLEVLRTIDQAKPDYVLASGGVVWDGVTAQPWFSGALPRRADVADGRGARFGP